MTPSEEAKKIYNQFYALFQPVYMPKAACREAKKACEIMVNVLISEISHIKVIIEKKDIPNTDYWKKVKTEIELINEL